MIETLKEILSLKALPELLQTWGWLSYPLLFAIVFSETGLLVGFFLPGDSLLFISGFAASMGIIRLDLLIALLCIAAIVGDTVGYHIGKGSGKWVANRPDSFFFKKEHLHKTQSFYEKHGGKTIILARFVPIIRTFAPFVAGMGRMNYRQFLFFNVFGGLLWVCSMTLAGYFLGNIPFVKHNFEKVVLLIIALSLVPVFIAFFKQKSKQQSN